MRGFAQIKALKLACLAEWGERESWEYPLCPPPSLPPCTSFTLRAGIWKGEGSSSGRRKTSSTCAHKEICSALSGGPSFSVSVNNERGLLFKWMWQSPQWTIRALSPPHRRRHHHWTTLDCLEAIWNKASAPLCCGGPACGLCAPSGANIWWNRRVCLCSSDVVALLLVEMFMIHMIHCSERKKLQKLKAKRKSNFSSPGWLPGGDFAPWWQVQQQDVSPACYQLSTHAVHVTMVVGFVLFRYE